MTDAAASPPPAWLTAAEAAIARRDVVEALRLLDKAEAEGAGGGSLFRTRALALRVGGRLADAVAALDRAIVEDPYDFVAHLSKGALLERLEQPRAAARAYDVALKVAPPTDRLPANLVGPLERAREAVRLEAVALQAHLRQRVATLRGDADAADLRRFDEALTVYSGAAKPFPQQPLLLHYPRLPAVPFYDRADFPWLGELEAATPTIQRELEGALAAFGGAFAPYIAYPPGAPVAQWGELNHSRRWSTLFLWRDGERQAAVCDACPETAALLERLPMAGQPGFAPTAMFSALEGRTTIPPHTGSANTRLIVHLPLVLPGPARFRVGAETRDWRMGEAWVFDDTVEHEAWNDADATRVILIFDVWNPQLTERERALISAMMTAKNAWAEGA